ncbi:hypothetical protein FHU30_003732 [Actinomadura rupiterrae]|nr:hypothetical protein [Actinomadura rupiterrae]
MGPPGASHPTPPTAIDHPTPMPPPTLRTPAPAPPRPTRHRAPRASARPTRHLPGYAPSPARASREGRRSRKRPGSVTSLGRRATAHFCVASALRAAVGASCHLPRRSASALAFCSTSRPRVTVRAAHHRPCRAPPPRSRPSARASHRFPPALRVRVQACAHFASPRSRLRTTAALRATVCALRGRPRFAPPPGLPATPRPRSASAPASHATFRPHVTARRRTRTGPRTSAQRPGSVSGLRATPVRASRERLRPRQRRAFASARPGSAPHPAPRVTIRARMTAVCRDSVRASRHLPPALHVSFSVERERPRLASVSGLGPPPSWLRSTARSLRRRPLLPTASGPCVSVRASHRRRPSGHLGPRFRLRRRSASGPRADPTSRTGRARAPAPARV